MKERHPDVQYVFPIKKMKYCFGMKLTGFGSGKYNGFGGKIDSLKGDKIIRRYCC